MAVPNAEVTGRVGRTCKEVIKFYEIRCFFVDCKHLLFTFSAHIFFYVCCIGQIQKISNKIQNPYLCHILGALGLHDHDAGGAMAPPIFLKSSNFWKFNVLS